LTHASKTGELALLLIPSVPQPVGPLSVNGPGASASLVSHRHRHTGGVRRAEQYSAPKAWFEDPAVTLDAMRWLTI